MAENSPTYVGRKTRPNGFSVARVTPMLGGVEQRSIPPRFDLANHSPYGFAWGYGGSGPAQLALAIIADATGNDAFALAHYQEFKSRVVERLPSTEGWELSRRDVMAELGEIVAGVSA